MRLIENTTTNIEKRPAISYEINLSLAPMENNSSKKSVEWIAWGVLTLLALVWGSSYVLIKWSLEVFTNVQLANLRISISALTFLPFFIYVFRKVDWSKWLALVVVGITGSGAPAFLFATAQTNLSSSMTGALSSLTPLFTLLIGVLFFRINATWTKYVGVSVGLLGAIMLVTYGNETAISGDWWYGALVVLACALYALSSNVVKDQLADMDALTLSSVSFFLIGIPTSVYLFSTDILSVFDTNPDAYKALGYVSILSILGTVMASILFYHLVHIKDALFASTVSYFIPIVALGWGIAEGEAITVFHLGGMALILLGVYIARK